MDRKAYVALMKVYTSSLGKLYERDIKRFFEEAKLKIAAGILVVSLYIENELLLCDETIIQ